MALPHDISQLSVSSVGTEINRLKTSGLYVRSLYTGARAGAVGGTLAVDQVTTRVLFRSTGIGVEGHNWVEASKLSVRVLVPNYEDLSWRNC